MDSQNRRQSGERPRDRSLYRWTSRALVRARSSRACCGARFARLDVSSRSLYAVIEPGSCFRRLAARTGAGGRPRVHARSVRRRRARLSHFRDEFRRARRSVTQASQNRRLDSMGCGPIETYAAASAIDCTRAKRSNWAWSPSRLTNSTGRTNFGWPSKAAPRFRPTL